MTHAEPRQRGLPVFASEVADHRDEPASVGDGADPVDRSGEIRVAETLGRWGGAEQRQDRTNLVRARAWRHDVDRWTRDQHGAQTVLVAGREEPDARGRGRRDVRLVVGDGTELHGGRHVDHQPGGQVAVGDLLTNVGLAGSGGDVPVDPADVVARLVQPRLARLRPVTRRQALVVAVQDPVEPSGDRELECAQQLSDGLGRRTGSPGVRACGGVTESARRRRSSGRHTRRTQCCHVQPLGALVPKASFGFGDTQVAGTVARMRWTTWSVVMSRARAS